MKSLKRIEQTKKAKEQYKHPIIDILLDHTTKQDIAQKLHCSEREARNIIAECAMHYPIITNSGQKGYRRAKNIDDLTDNQLLAEYNDVQLTINDLKSRIKCLKKRLKPLIAWQKMAEKLRLKELKKDE